MNRTLKIIGLAVDILIIAGVIWVLTHGSEVGHFLGRYFDSVFIGLIDEIDACPCETELRTWPNTNRTKQ
jgi:hypothetical protein